MDKEQELLERALSTTNEPERRKAIASLLYPRNRRFEVPPPSFFEALGSLLETPAEDLKQKLETARELLYGQEGI